MQTWPSFSESRHCPYGLRDSSRGILINPLIIKLIAGLNWPVRSPDPFTATKGRKNEPAGVEDKEKDRMAKYRSADCARQNRVKGLSRILCRFFCFGIMHLENAMESDIRCTVGLNAVADVSSVSFIPGCSSIGR